MSADPNAPLFVISDGDDIKYNDDTAVAQAKANLTAVEQIQQERAKQRRLEREEWKAQAEAVTSMDADLSTYPILIPPVSNTFHFCHHPQPHHSQPYHAQSIIYQPSFIINGNS